VKKRGSQRDKRSHSMSDTTLYYHWDIRPAFVPLERKEVTIALKIAEWDAERAADLLKVNTSRLMGFLRGHTDLYRQVELKTVYPFISIQDGDDGITITIKPDRSWKRITARNETNGATVITLDKVSREHKALVRRAQAIMREGE
jgi:hypothetical protein